MLDLVFRNKTKDHRYSEKFFHDILAAAEKTVVKNFAKVEVSVTLVGPAEMQKLNRTYRHKDQPTDVLSFPLGDTPGNPYNTLTAGDIFLCVFCAKEKAKSQGESLDRYVAWMTIHGFLHLLGYDHEKSPAVARKMSALENKILKILEPKA